MVGNVLSLTLAVYVDADNPVTIDEAPDATISTWVKGDCHCTVYGGVPPIKDKFIIPLLVLLQSPVIDK